MCMACYSHICALPHVRSSISTNIAIMVACWLWVPGSTTARLVGRCILEELAQTTDRTEYAGACCHRNRRWDCITLVLAKLFWLSFLAHIMFKIVTLISNPLTAASWSAGRIVLIKNPRELTSWLVYRSRPCSVFSYRFVIRDMIGEIRRLACELILTLWLLNYFLYLSLGTK